MSLAIGLVIFIVIIPAFILKYLIGRENEMKTNNENGRSRILFDANTSERNTTPEEVFKTLDKAGVKVSFLQNKSN